MHHPNRFLKLLLARVEFVRRARHPKEKPVKKEANTIKKMPMVREAAPTAVGASYNLMPRVVLTPAGRRIMRDCF